MRSIYSGGSIVFTYVLIMYNFPSENVNGNFKIDLQMRRIKSLAIEIVANRLKCSANTFVTRKVF